MRACELLAELRQRGLDLAVEGDRLRYRPREVVTPELRAAMVAHKAELLGLLAKRACEVDWRVEAMRPQVPRTGPIPFLAARRSGPVPDDACLSCGDPLPRGGRYCCPPCREATWRVLNEVREGVPRDTCSRGATQRDSAW